MDAIGNQNLPELSPCGRSPEGRQDIMSITNEKKICQNCRGEFIIEPEDFSFYEKIGVPAPTFCPECRLVRRLAFRNERTLYRRACDLCKKEKVMMYPA